MTLSETAEGGGDVVLEARGVTHQFIARGKTVTALQDVDFSVHDGDFVTIVGPSGCGKSTLLSLFAGLLKPTAGEVTYRGQSIDGPSRDRGVVFQDLAILPWRTVERNIGHGLELAGVPKQARRDRVEELIELVGLKGFEDRYPKELSGGMRQRVAVARTWATDPPVILMDEPFAAVDAMTRITLQEELIRLAKSTKKTVLFITHSVEEAVFLGDYVAAMTPRPGQISEIVPVPHHGNRGSWDEMVQEDTVQEVVGRVMALVRGESAAPNRGRHGDD